MLSLSQGETGCCGHRHPRYYLPLLTCCASKSEREWHTQMVAKGAQYAATRRNYRIKKRPSSIWKMLVQHLGNEGLMYKNALQTQPTQENTETDKETHSRSVFRGCWCLMWIHSLQNCTVTVMSSLVRSNCIYLAPIYNKSYPKTINM